MATNETYDNSADTAASNAKEIKLQRLKDDQKKILEGTINQIISGEYNMKEEKIEQTKITNKNSERQQKRERPEISPKTIKRKIKMKKRKIFFRRLAATTAAVAIIGSIIYSQREEIAKAPENIVTTIESMINGGMTEEEKLVSFTEKTKDLQEKFNEESPADVINSFENEKDANTAFLVFNALNYNSDNQGIISKTAEQCNYINPNNDKTSIEALNDFCEQNGKNISRLSAQTGESYTAAAQTVTSELASETIKDIATGELTVPTVENTKGGNTL